MERTTRILATVDQVAALSELSDQLQITRDAVLVTALDEGVIAKVDSYGDLTYHDAEALLDWLRNTAAADPDYVRRGGVE